MKLVSAQHTRQQQKAGSVLGGAHSPEWPRPELEILLPHTDVQRCLAVAFPGRNALTGTSELGAECSGQLLGGGHFHTGCWICLGLANPEAVCHPISPCGPGSRSWDICLACEAGNPLPPSLSTPPPYVPEQTPMKGAVSCFPAANRQ